MPSGDAPTTYERSTILFLSHVCLISEVWLYVKLSYTSKNLTHCSLVAPFDDMGMGQYWLRKWLVVQTITWTNADLSWKVFCGIHLRAISQEMLKNLIYNLCPEITLFKITTSPIGQWVNTLSLRQNGHHFADAIFKCIFLNENISISMKISLKFVPKGPINNIPALVHIMAWRRPGDKPLSEPVMV